ncbi:hypothetical protein DPMN_027424 [Dreissena polymorpha]|uniref:Uncharacterized protein n=1 Tax=Dreissena polymorpha TaxID=45954 RepID=A0A9D4RF81_DREPO|nr:hypothetical protein DPMN_027424 [Dreissena polymorpha]
MARQRPTRLVMGPCIVEINHIVIREVQYQFEVNRCRNEEVIWPGRTDGQTAEITTISPRFSKSVGIKTILGGCGLLWAGCSRVGNGAIHINRCRNEEIIVKGNFGWAWPMWLGIPRVGNGAMHKVQYQFEVNRCRDEEIIVKGNFGWAWPM